LFEKRFYQLDKTITQSDYKRIYFIPTLESKLAWCLNNSALWRKPDHEQMRLTLELLQREIGYELNVVGEDKLPEINRLVAGQVDSLVCERTSEFLQTLKQFYMLKASKAAREKEAIVRQLTETPEAEEEFQEMKERYVNEAVSDMVKNVSAKDRIVEYEGRLIQKIYPVYMDEHRPMHFFDFSANLYQPTKHFMGQHWDTLLFNMAVIWSMTVVLFLTLYFDVLRKFIQFLEGNRKYRRRERG